MSRSLKDPSKVPKDYGATSSTSAATTSGAVLTLPDVSFSQLTPTEFMSLSEDIAHNITAINTNAKQMENILKTLDTTRNIQTTRAKVHNIQSKTNVCIEETSKHLQRLTAVVKRSDKQHKLHLEKLTNDFRTLVENYSAVQRRIAEVMKKTYTQQYVIEMQDAQAESDQAELLQQQQEIQSGLQFEQEMLIDRERIIKQIEEDILDVNAIMRTISSTLYAQGEQIDRIDTVVETAATNVELGRDEIIKASQRRQSYRRKVLILLAIAVIIGVIVTGIIVGKLTN